MTRIVTTRRSAMIGLSLVGFVAGLAPDPSWAFDASSPNPTNVDATGLVLRGYDPVAYFAADKAVRGVAEFNATYNGATYHFVSAANRDAFKADPAKYEPRFGGFCAMGVAMGKKLDGDPEVFRVVDGKLYLNVSRDVQKKWSEDVPANLSAANKKWPSISAKPPKEIN